MKLFKADPYDVQVLNALAHEADFGQVIAAIEKLSPDENSPPNESRWGGYGNSQIAIDNLRKGPPIVGTVFMAKNEDLSLVGGRRSGIKRPKLDDDEGMGKHIAFLWDQQRQILWVQRDRNSVGMTAFKDHLMDRTNFSLTITPRMHPNTLARMNKLKYLKRIDLTFSKRHDGKESSSVGTTTLMEFLDLRDRLDAATIEVTIKASKGKFLGAGSRGLLRDTAKQLREGFDELRGARVLGVTEFDENEEGDWQTVDLLRDKMHFELELDRSRFREPKALMVAIKRLWDDHGSEA
jgi:hypothetical protein